jgi:hypothetical protein
MNLHRETTAGALSIEGLLHRPAGILAASRPAFTGPTIRTTVGSFDEISMLRLPPPLTRLFVAIHLFIIITTIRKVVARGPRPVC